MKSTLSADNRREALLDALYSSAAPISASVLAARFSVSRQIIVGDIALLRAAGENISATPRGYIVNRSRPGQLRTLACVHSLEDTAKELHILIIANVFNLSILYSLNSKFSFSSWLHTR